MEIEELLKILKQIDDGYKERKKMQKAYTYIDARGKGSKSYLIRRIDLLRDELLRLKKSLKEE